MTNVVVKTSEKMSVLVVMTNEVVKMGMTTVVVKRFGVQILFPLGS